MLRVIVVDDEPLARGRLKRMLEPEMDYQVVAEAENGEQAIAQVVKYAPDIILMDIRMPGIDGLQAAQQLAQQDNPPAIIFCTAYDEYAINAFDVQAVGYVLKPVRKPALLEALARAQKLSRVQVNALLPKQQASPSIQREHISITTPAGLELLALQDISHFRADQKYVMAYCDGRERIVDEPLKELEMEFAKTLLRIHRNCLVSVSYIEAIQRTKTGQSQLQLRNVDEPQDVSRRHLAQLKEVMKRI
ncbi:MAG: LytTR family DNA-binding domain-containing protein [Pseudomonadales bacterium]